MSGSKKLILDTNILIYHLQQSDESIAKLIEDNNVSISVISKIELLGWNKISDGEIEIFNVFLETLNIYTLSPKVVNYAINLRRKYNLKTPDSIIAATSIIYNSPLVTNDSDFNKIENLKIIEYN